MTEAQARRAARALIDRMGKRHALMDARDPRAERALADHAHAERLVQQEMAGRMFGDAGRLQKLAARHDARLTAAMEGADARAVAGSAALVRTLDTLRPRPALPLDPETLLVEQMLFIRSFAGQGTVIDSRIGPQDNFARYLLAMPPRPLIQVSSTGRLSFFALWRNPKQRTVTAKVDAAVQLSARVSAAIDATYSVFFSPAPRAHAALRLRTTVSSLDRSTEAVIAERDLDKVEVQAGFFSQWSARTVTFADLLPGGSVLVRARQFLLIELSLLTDWYASAFYNARIKVDAQSGSFGMLVPYLQVTIS
jgi:hypothetical protein